MPTAVTSKLAECIEALKEAGHFALDHPTVEDFIDLERQVTTTEAMIRELQQDMWSNEAKATIKRLEKNQPLTEADRDVIRTFIVSDAEHYLAQENDFHNWLRELHRLLDELARRAHVVDRGSIGDLRGVMKDAVRLIPDIRNYLEEQRRVDRFDLAQTDLDTQSRTMLARILKEQLTSPSR